MHNYWRNYKWLWGLIPILFLFGAIFYPIINLLLTAFGGNNSEIFGLTNRWFDLVDFYYFKRIIITIFQAATASFICLLLGIPIALAIWLVKTQQLNPNQSSREYVLYKIRTKSLNQITKLLLLPFILPVMVVILAIRAISFELSSEGFIPLITTYVFYNLGLAVWLIFNALMRIPVNIINSAKTLGATNWQILVKVILPMIKNSINSAFVLVFLFCSSSFGVAFLIGGQKWATLEVEIYLLATQSLNLQAASILAILQMTIMLILMVYFSKQQFALPLAFSQNKNIWQLPNWFVNLISIIILAITLVILSPIITLLIKSFTNSASVFSLLFSNPDFYLALTNTLLFPIIAIPIAFVFAWCSAIAVFSTSSSLNFIPRKNTRNSLLFSLLFYSPYMISATVLALGLLITYPFFGGNLLILIFAYTFLAYPLLARNILLAWQQHNPLLPLAVVNLGGNKFQAFYHGVLPQIIPQLRTGLAFATATMIGEFSSTLFLSRPEWLTLSTFIYQYLGKVGKSNVDQAQLCAGILIVLTLVVIYLIHGRTIFAKKNPYAY